MSGQIFKKFLKFQETGLGNFWFLVLHFLYKTSYISKINEIFCSYFYFTAVYQPCVRLKMEKILDDKTNKQKIILKYSAL